MVTISTFARTFLLLSVIASASCHAKSLTGSLTLGNNKSPTKTISLDQSLPFTRRGLLIRGGDADYSGDARSLFANLITPSTMLAGSLVPLGFLAPPLPSNKPYDKRLKKAYSLIAILSLCNVAAAVIYATVASNKLTEIVPAPAPSVFALIQRDYALPWIATNVHFLCGLFGFMGLIGLRAVAVFPSHLNKASAGIALSALLGMFSIVNRGVSAGDGEGHVFGSSIWTLATRYVVLLAKRTKASKGIMATTSIVLGIASVAFAIHEVIVNDENEDPKAKRR